MAFVISPWWVSRWSVWEVMKKVKSQGDLLIGWCLRFVEIWGGLVHQNISWRVRFTSCTSYKNLIHLIGFHVRSHGFLGGGGQEVFFAFHHGHHGPSQGWLNATHFGGDQRIKHILVLIYIFKKTSPRENHRKSKKKTCIGFVSR